MQSWRQLVYYNPDIRLKLTVPHPAVVVSIDVTLVKVIEKGMQGLFKKENITWQIQQTR